MSNFENKLSLKKPEIIFLSLFGAGFLPKAPGTWGTAFTLPFVWGYCVLKIPFVFILPFYIITFFGAIVLINFVQKKYQVGDASWIVIDEALGFFIMAPFINGESIYHLALAFGLFRLLDAAKIYPVNWIDKNIKGGLGVILDDIAAGILATISYKIIILSLTQIFF